MRFVFTMLAILLVTIAAKEGLDSGGKAAFFGAILFILLMGIFLSP